MTQLCYRYHNPGLTRMDLWVAQPADGNTQDMVRLERASQTPVQIEKVGSGRVVRYRLRPGETLALDWAFRPLAASVSTNPSEIPVLDAEERARYLRASPQISREPEVVGRAQALVMDCSDSTEMARVFFQTLVSEFAYHFPVRNRGALAMTRSKRGDCGQFAALFCAWCRAVDIPARPVVGTLIGPGRGMLPHMWAEFWSDAHGWAPVDPSMAQAISSPDNVFGRLPANRFTFAYDMDSELPAYGRPVRFPPLSVLMPWSPRFDSRRLSWGAATVDGMVPYFQPAYPRVYSAWGPNWLIGPEPLGLWAIDGPPSSGSVGHPRLGVTVFCAGFIGSLVHDNTVGTVAQVGRLAEVVCFLMLVALSIVSWRKRRRLYVSGA